MSLGQQFDIDAAIDRFDIYPDGVPAANGANGHPAGMRKVEMDVMPEIEVEFWFTVCIGTKTNSVVLQYRAQRMSKQGVCHDKNGPILFEGETSGAILFVAVQLCAQAADYRVGERRYLGAIEQDHARSGCSFRASG